MYVIDVPYSIIKQFILHDTITPLSITQNSNNIQIVALNLNMRFGMSCLIPKSELNADYNDYIINIKPLCEVYE